MGLALWLVPSSSEVQRFIQAEIHSLSNTSFGIFTQVDQAAIHLSSPPSAPFPAHATLLSGLQGKTGSPSASGWDQGALWTQVLQGVQEWREEMGYESESGDGSEKQSRLQCSVNELTTRGTYFQCLLLALSLPTPLARLNQIMRRRLFQEPLIATATAKVTASAPVPPPYYPHISLLYASLPVQEVRSLIAHLQHDRQWFQSSAAAAAQRGEAKVKTQVEAEEGEKDKGASIGIEVGTKISFDRLQLWDCNGPVAGWKRLKSMNLHGGEDMVAYRDDHQ